MPLLTFLAEMLESGKITIYSNNTEALRIEANEKRIDIEALSKTIIKDTLAITRQGQDYKNKGLTETLMGKFNQIRAARSELGILKEDAEELSDAGITVTLSYEGKVIATVGSEANAKISSILTGTKSIEINNPLKLAELSV